MTNAIITHHFGQHSHERMHVVSCCAVGHSQFGLRHIISTVSLLILSIICTQITSTRISFFCFFVPLKSYFGALLLPSQGHAILFLHPPLPFPSCRNWLYLPFTSWQSLAAVVLVSAAGRTSRARFPRTVLIDVVILI